MAMAYEYSSNFTLKGLFRSIRFKSEFGLPRSQSWTVLNQFKIKDWYFQVMDEWPYWPDSKCANDWIIKNVQKSAKVLDTGCGIGSHLIRLEKNGFHSLHGSDIEPEVIKAGKALNKLSTSKIILEQEDCLNPQKNKQPFDVIIFMSWIYHQNEFSISDVLKLYLPYMATNCKIVINLVDSEFSKNPNNQWNSNDWHRPIEDRRKSQYLLRHGHQDVLYELEDLPFKILQYEKFHKKVPKLLYILEKSE
jgi:SAM-dependent methyltransferase